MKIVILGYSWKSLSDPLQKSSYNLLIVSLDALLFNEGIASNDQNHHHQPVVPPTPVFGILAYYSTVSLHMLL